MARITARGKYLFEGGKKFFARGVSYGPFPPNSRGERYPEPERAAADFALMRAMGVNVVRTYVAPPKWMLEEAIKHGLRLMVGIPWPFHMAFLDSAQMMADIRNAIRTGVEDVRGFGDAVLAYSLGNEIRSDMVRWHGPRAVSRFLAELHDIGKQIDPDGLFTYSNYPTTEYLDLGFLDFLSYNVYLHHEDDYRRYLTHLMAQAGERPVLLSETGMDTIREGEEAQAALLGWQSRAAFEIGLSGFIVFAFTDEWHTGGVEITDWAFGLVTKDRKPKRAFETVGVIFRGELPPPLKSTLKVSVVVAAYNAAATIERCVDSLKSLNYPDYEIIVVDDGSTDLTADLSERAGAKTIRVTHRGLSDARNAGIEAASGEIVAFIDADAHADRDWLYHLVEAIVRREAAAAGGPNFTPHDSDASCAYAFAPGLPTQVTGAGDELLQLCGCNMAIRKSALAAIGGFDSSFTSAGDDVDVSWRLANTGGVLVDAPGAVVMHERRGNFRDYLAQQRGYGEGEGLLFRKYPLRGGSARSLYAGAGSWLSAVLGGPRVYHGAFGRGLFQSLYTAADLPWLAELPQSAQWIAASIVLILAGSASAFLGALGIAGLVIFVAVACLAAVSTDTGSTHTPIAERAMLAILYMAGPLARSFARERVRMRLDTSADGVPSIPYNPWGRITIAPQTEGAPIPDSSVILESIRGGMVRYGVPVAATDGYQSWDLRAVLPPTMRVDFNAIRESDRVSIAWRTTAEPRGAIIAIAAIFVLLLGAGMYWIGALAMAAIIVAGGIAVAMLRVVRIPSLLRASCESLAASSGFKVVAETGESQ